MEDNKKFVHLHVHSTYSILDGIARRTDLIKKAKEYNQGAMAITDHGNMFNMVGFYKDCAEAGVKPIIGSEFYVAPDSRFGRQYSTKGAAEEKAKDGDLSMSAYHLTVLSKNRDGYNNLIKLSSAAYREGFYRKPRIDDELLMQHKSGLIILSGCLASKVSRLIVAGNKAKALEEVDKMRGIFGEDFYLEVMAHNIDEEIVVREALLEFGHAHGIPVVMTGDSHFTEHGDEAAHEVALAIGTGKMISDPDRFKFNGDGYWFKSTAEMYGVAEDANIPSHALSEAANIADKIQDYGFKLGKSIIPKFKNDTGTILTSEECNEALSSRAMAGLVSLGLNKDKVYTDRLERELNMIKSKDFSSYFLIIADIIDFMRKSNILTPIGRGSSMGSLVCYCLSIIGRDPIRWGIPFERFINEGRKDLPDIDTDISQIRRKEVIGYIVNKYGKDRVAQIVTFQSMGAKAVIDNVGRALGVPHAVRKQVSAAVGEVTKEDKLDDLLSSNSKANDIMQQTPSWISVANRLEGNNRNLGAHAAGIVISNDPIVDHVPLIRDSDEGYMITQYDMRDLSELGLLKLDMLGLKTLDLIQNTIEMIRQRRGTVIDFHNVPVDDEATYKTVADGKYVSIFQYDSSGIRSAAKALKPEKFEHLIALNALYRPGPMLKIGKEPSIMERYIERRHGREQVDVWHPSLESVFNETYGLPIFQEQVMAISQIMGGFTDTEADGYRAAIGKKDKVKFAAVQAKLIDRGVALGHPKSLMVDITDKMAGSARYNWNKGHGLAYSYITYVTAFLETHYPHEYYTTLLNVNLDDNDQLKVLLSGILQRGVQILPPHINNSQSQFYTDGKSIYMGIYSVRQVGDVATTAILGERDHGGPYADFVDFCVRMSKHGRVSSLVKGNLIKAGAFDFDTTLTNKDKVQNLDTIQKIVKKFADKVSPADVLDQVQDKITRTGEEYEEQEALALERSVLNFYISSHPCTPIQPLFSLFQTANIITPSAMQDQPIGSKAVVLGVLESIEMKQTKTGNPYLFLKVGDQWGSKMYNIWSPLAQTAHTKLVNQQMVLLSGVIKDDKFRPGENQLYTTAVATMHNGGLPVSAFYTDSPARILDIANTIGAEVQSISNPIPHIGHVVMLKQAGYINPTHLDKLSVLSGVQYVLAI